MVGCFVVNKSRIIPWKEWTAAEVLLVQKTTVPSLPWLSHPRGKTIQCSHHVGTGKKWGGDLISRKWEAVAHPAWKTGTRRAPSDTQHWGFSHPSVKMLNPVGLQVHNKQTTIEETHCMWKQSAWSLRGAVDVVSHTTVTKVLIKAEIGTQDLVLEAEMGQDTVFVFEARSK